jgi:hypothetical protein
MNDTKDDAAQPLPPPKYLEEERLQGDAKKAQDWQKILISLINALVGWLIGHIPGGLGWRDPNPARAAFDAKVDEQARTPELDKPSEVFRVGRRIKMGATLNHAQLSEPVMGALLCMSKPDLTALLLECPNAIARWTAIQQGVASPESGNVVENLGRRPAPTNLPRQRGTGFEEAIPAMR